MEFIQITDDKLVNVDNIVSVEKRKKNFSVITTDGKQHTIENDINIVLSALNSAGVRTPKQFWAG